MKSKVVQLSCNILIYHSGIHYRFGDKLANKAKF